MRRPPISKDPQYPHRPAKVHPVNMNLRHPDPTMRQLRPIVGMKLPQQGGEDMEGKCYPYKVFSDRYGSIFWEPFKPVQKPCRSERAFYRKHYRCAR